MKWAQSLIRIAEHEIDGLRKRVAEITGRRMACEMMIERLKLEGLAETESARRDAESGWYLIGFREGLKQRHEQAVAELAAAQMEEQGARDALSRAYEELKKVEHVAEMARIAANKVAAARETAALDEIALRRVAVGRR